jgi:hypothetical protein
VLLVPGLERLGDSWLPEMQQDDSPCHHSVPHMMIAQCAAHDDRKQL